MKIVIKTKGIKLNQALRDFIKEKIESLEKFSEILQEKYFSSPSPQGKAKVQIWVEIGKITKHHRKGPVFWAECQMRFPKKSLRSTAQSEDLRLAITEVKDELQRQLKRYRDRAKSKIEKGQRSLKKSLRLSPSARLKRKKGARIREEGT